MPDNLKVYEFTWSDHLDEGHVVVVAHSKEEALAKILRADHQDREFSFYLSYELDEPVFIVSDDLMDDD